MQDQTMQIDVTTAKERLSAAISRVERAVLASKEKNFAKESARVQVVKELDTHISSLEKLLNTGGK